MPVSIKTELDEAIARAVARRTGESVLSWLYGTFWEFFEVGLVGVAATDETNKTADLAQLETDLGAGVTKLLSLVKLPWGLPMTLKGLTPILIGGLLKPVGDFSGSIEAFKAERLAPVFVAARSRSATCLEKLGVVDAVD